MKLSFYNTTYYINEEKQTVTCKTYYRITSNDIELIRNMEYLTGNIRNNGKNKYYAVGTARLDDCDNWNVEVGEKVARAKAETKAYEYMAKHINRLACDTRKISGKIDMLCGKVSKMAQKVKSHNDEYLKQF